MICYRCGIKFKSESGRMMCDNCREKCSSVKQTLCFSCERLDCSWMKDLKPVEGWKANKSSIKYNNGGISYNVVHCPEYKPFPERRVNEDDR